MIYDLLNILIGLTREEIHIYERSLRRRIREELERK